MPLLRLDAEPGMAAREVGDERGPVERAGHGKGYTRRRVSRRGLSVHQHARWVFNRLAADYAHRPGYPEAVVARLVALAGGAGARAVDLGAGTGHLAVPLARAGLRVHAVEPARAMLDVLARAAADAGATAAVTPVHAAAEETALPAAEFELAVLADALQWVDPERAGREIARLLMPGGVLAIVEPRLADTPFLAALGKRIAKANFKARRAELPVGLVCSLAAGTPPAVERFEHEVVLDDAALEAVLRSLSFVGPALGQDALDALVADAKALAREHGGALWRREILVHRARRSQ
jgi:SAM-dependent methyltransferase